MSWVLTLISVKSAIFLEIQLFQIPFYLSMFSPFLANHFCEFIFIEIVAKCHPGQKKEDFVKRNVCFLSAEDHSQYCLRQIRWHQSRNDLKPASWSLLRTLGSFKWDWKLLHHYSTKVDNLWPNTNTRTHAHTLHVLFRRTWFKHNSKHGPTIAQTKLLAHNCAPF